MEEGAHKKKKKKEEATRQQGVAYCMWHLLNPSHPHYLILRIIKSYHRSVRPSKLKKMYNIYN